MNLPLLKYMVKAKFNQDGRYDWHPLGYFYQSDDAKLFLNALRNDKDFLVDNGKIKIDVIVPSIQCTMVNSVIE